MNEQMYNFRTFLFSFSRQAIFLNNTLFILQYLILKKIVIVFNNIFIVDV